MTRFGKGFRAFDVREAAIEYEARHRAKRSSTTETANGSLRNSRSASQDAERRGQHDERNDREGV